MSDEGPAYKLGDLIAACVDGRWVGVSAGALDDAARHFDLHTKEMVLDFIAKGELEEITHQDTRRLELGPNHGAWVDAYRFHSGPTRCGYLAFYRAMTGKWMIKSFKKNDRSELRHSALHDALRKLINGK